MPQRVTRKWRPPLALVVGGTLAGVLGVPLIGIGYFRVAGNVLGWAETAWLIAWMAIISTAILGFLLWRLVLRPVYALTAHARAVKNGHVDVPLPSQFGTTEFSDLGQSVIDMGETLNNRAAGLRAYAGHVTHELKSPLTAISGAAELLQDATDDADHAALISTIKQAADRMAVLLEDMRQHAAAGLAKGGGHCDLAGVAASLVGLEIEVVQGGTVPLPQEDLQAILTQLVQNARVQGANRIDLRWTDGVLQVHDDGTGVAAGNQARLFDPFFTTTRANGGTGMGLNIVQALAGAHGAQVRFVPTDAGARFDLVF